MNNYGKTIRTGLVLIAIGLVGMVGVYLLALLGTPTERWQGLAQKILYVHAPSAWSSPWGARAAGSPRRSAGRRSVAWASRSRRRSSR